MTMKRAIIFIVIAFLPYSGKSEESMGIAGIADSGFSALGDAASNIIDMVSSDNED